MRLSQKDFEDILRDDSKTVEGDLVWEERERGGFLFKTQIQTKSNRYNLIVGGTYIPIKKTLSYYMLCPPHGRIYALDLGVDHKNPDKSFTGEKHKHRWSEIYKDKEAYVPQDITASVTEPVKVWQQFCLEAIIHHNGVMKPIPEQEFNLFP